MFLPKSNCFYYLYPCYQRLDAQSQIHIHPGLCLFDGRGKANNNPMFLPKERFIPMSKLAIISLLVCLSTPAFAQETESTASKLIALFKDTAAELNRQDHEFNASVDEIKNIIIDRKDEIKKTLAKASEELTLGNIDTFNLLMAKANTEMNQLHQEFDVSVKKEKLTYERLLKVAKAETLAFGRKNEIRKALAKAGEELKLGNFNTFTLLMNRVDVEIIRIRKELNVSMQNERLAYERLLRLAAGGKK